MRTIVFLCMFLLANMAQATSIFELKIQMDEKLEGTYSALLNKKSTIHFIMVKNYKTKKYALRPFLIDEYSKVTPFKPYVSKRMSSIISYHVNGNVISLIGHNDDKKELLFIDYNLSTGEFITSKQEQKIPYAHIFRLKDKTLIIDFDKKNNILSVNTITSSEKKETTEILIPKGKLKFFRKLAEKNPESINQNEYVKHGSISDTKSYLINNRIFYTITDGGKDVQVFQFDLDKKTDFEYAAIPTGFPMANKNSGNYLYDDKLAIIGTEKENMILNIYDLKTFSLQNSFSFRDALKSAISNDSVNKYLRTVGKTYMRPTLTLNKTVQNKIAVHIDQVNSTEYSYNFNWWFQHWFFQQQMCQQQPHMRQVQMSDPRGFGPSDPGEYYMGEIKLRKKTTSLDFVLEPDFKTLNTDKQELVFAEIDRDKYLQKFNDNKTIKEFSSEFTETEIRYLYLNTKSKTLIIETEKL